MGGSLDYLGEREWIPREVVQGVQVPVADFRFGSRFPCMVLLATWGRVCRCLGIDFLVKIIGYSIEICTGLMMCMCSACCCTTKMFVPEDAASGRELLALVTIMGLSREDRCLHQTFKESKDMSNGKVGDKSHQIPLETRNGHVVIA